MNGTAMDTGVSFDLLVLIAVLGLGGGVVSGLLGIGGGILLAPLLLYVPPAMGQPALDMRTVAGLTIVQSLFAGLSATLTHHRRGRVHVELAGWLGGTMVVTSFAGAWWSRSVGSEALLFLFALLALLAAGLMLLPRDQVDDDLRADDVDFVRKRAVAIGVVIGFAGGMVGQSGAFLVIPAMIHVLRVPVRTALGTTLAVVVLAALAGTAGKLATGQIDFGLAASLVPAGVVGAGLGARWSERVRADVLRRALAWVIAGAAIRMFFDLRAHFG